MAAYPETPQPTWVHVLTQEYRTLITEFDSGAEQRRAKWLRPKYHLQLTYSALLSSEADALWNFYSARSGALESFSYFVPYSAAFVGLYCGTGDGTSTAFTLPAKQSAGHVVYVGGVATTAYAISTAAGPDGADLLRFPSGAPASGSPITCDCTGRLRVICRFGDDSLSREYFEAGLYRYGIRLQGLST